MSAPDQPRFDSDEWLFAGRGPGCWQLNYKQLLAGVRAICRYKGFANWEDEAGDIVGKVVADLIRQRSSGPPAKLVHDATGRTYGSWWSHPNGEPSGRYVPFSTREDCLAYTYQLARFKIGERLRELKRDSRLSPLGDHDPAAAGSPGQDLEAREAVEEIFRENRNDPCLALFEMHAAGLTAPQIGERLGTTAGAVRVRLTRCRNQFRDRYPDYADPRPVREKTNDADQH